MDTNQPLEIGKYLKGKSNVLLLAGSLCDEVDFNGKKLLDYAAQIANKIGVPIAATGNTTKGLRERSVERVKKMWVAEVLEYLRYPWQDPVIEHRPEVLVFIGYSPAVAQRLVSAVQDTDCIVLGDQYIEGALYCLPDASLGQWQQNLEQLLQALEK